MTPSVCDLGLSVTEVAETGLSKLDAEAGDLHVRGYSIEDIAANATYETVAWLLFNGDLPSDDELATFQGDLADARSLSQQQQELVQAGATADVPVMDVLLAGLGAERFRVGVENTLQSTRRVIATCPTLVAAYWRATQGLAPVAPRADLSHVANYLYMLSGTEPPGTTVEGLETYLTTISEHGLNPSAFAARIVASAGSDPLSAATGAVGALKGTRHGGDIARVHEMLDTIDVETDLAARAAQYVADGALPGFGHSVYETPDPRADIIEDAAERAADCRDASGLLETARKFEAAVTDTLADEHSDRDLYVNVDYYTVALLHGLNIPPAVFTATFAIGRAAGWMAHYLEQFESEQVLRPRTRYVGPEERPWVAPDSTSAEAKQPSQGTLERISSTLNTLSEPTRLELLTVLSEAREPLSYSTLRSRSAIEDKGRFNYHLRQLRGDFLKNTADGYSLTAAGQSALDTLLDDDQPLTDVNDA